MKKIIIHIYLLSPPPLPLVSDLGGMAFKNVFTHRSPHRRITSLPTLTIPI